MRFQSPIVPFFVAVFGGVAMMSAGIVTFVVLTPFLYPGSPDWVGVAGAGTVDIVAGLVVVALGALLLVDPSRPSTIGIAIFVVSLVSYLGGGGFFVGLILGAAAGISALFVMPSGTEQHVANVTSTAPPAADRQCPRCGRACAGGSTQCPFCGAPSVGAA